MRKAIFIINFCIALSIGAQNFTRPGEWKKYRKEVFISMGASEFLGDLGGRSRIGTHLSPVDVNFAQTRTAFGAGFRYKLEKWLNWTSKFAYCIVKGDDAQTGEPFRNNRNLNFKSNIFELSTRVEVGYQTQKIGGGNRYGIRKTLGRRVGKITQSYFFFAGIGVFHYNPKGKEPNGDYVALRPLHTEGQGLPGGPKQYSNWGMCIPIGIFYKMNIKKQWAVGLEFAWRKTFTDYIDDVSTRYYDNATLAAAYGPLSAQMADPSIGTIPGATKPAGDGLAAQRGSPKDKDSYFTLEITVGYTFKQQRKRARLRSKF